MTSVNQWNFAIRFEAYEPLDLSEQLRTFLARSISSVEHVEVLLLLKRSPGRFWTAEHIGSELRRSPQSVARRLQALLRSKVVQRDAAGGFAYLPGAHDAVVAELEQEYDQRRVRLIEAIFTAPAESARSFADAFRLWENDDDR